LPTLAQASAGLFLMAIGAALAPVGVHLASRVSPGRRVAFVRWGFKHVVLVVLSVLGALTVLGALPELEGANAALWASVAVLALAGGAAVACARAREPEPLAALGLRRGGNARALGCALVAYLFCAPLIVGSFSVWTYLYERVSSVPWEPQSVVLDLSALAGPDFALAALAAVVVAPFLEELLFRGFLQPLLVQNLSDKLGIVVTSAVFALLHGVAYFLPLFVLSLVLGGVMLRTQRLSAAWFVHALHNGLMVLLLATDSLPEH
jgi:membrane protease YdiL (CAAX protease family)